MTNTVNTSFITQIKDLYFKKDSYSLFSFGFSAGLPYMLLFSSLSFWLAEANINKSSIGFFSWILIVFAFKWVISPCLDSIKFKIFSLDKRRSWIFIAQFFIAFSLFSLAFIDPNSNLKLFAFIAFCCAFFSSIQDIAIDAYRIEIATDARQGSLAASYMFGYRLAMILSGAGTLYLADFFSKTVGYDLKGWQTAYLFMGFIMLLNILNTIFFSKKLTLENQPKEKKEANFYINLVLPFLDFFKRYKKEAFWILALVATYRISDIFLGVMANPFYVDLGFSKSEVASVAKIFGVIMTLLGTAIGGVLVHKHGANKILYLGAFLVIATNLLFALLALVGDFVCLQNSCLANFKPDIFWLMLVISADNISAGIATASFIAYLSLITNRNYSATQYALFSSIMLLIPKFFAGFSGIIVNNHGYFNFFLIASFLGLPTFFFIHQASKNIKRKNN